MKLSPSKQLKNILGKFRCVLSTEQEEELKTYLKNVDAAFYGLTIMELRVLFMSIAQDIVFCTHSIGKERWQKGIL